MLLERDEHRVTSDSEVDRDSPGGRQSGTRAQAALEDRLADCDEELPEERHF